MIRHKRILDSVHGNILVEEKYFQIIDTPYFQRLRQIEQTSIRSIFPCAHHDRFVHSIGVFYIGSLIVKHLAEDVDNVRKKYCIRNRTFVKIAETYKIACLLHDVGHAPFSHSFENYYDTIVKDENGEEKSSLSIRIAKNCSLRFKKELPDKVKTPHEYCSAILTLEVFQPMLAEAFPEVDWELAARMIIGVQYSNVENDVYLQICNCFIRLLNGGVVDADRLDYTSRDVWASGYATSMIDIRRLISSLHIKQYTDENRKTLFTECYDSNVLNEIESIVKVKDFQIQNVINHHTTVYEQELLQQAAEDMALRYVVKPNGESYNEGGEALSSILSVETLEHGIDLAGGLHLYNIADGDLIFLIKQIGGNLYEQWSSRKYTKFALWKTRNEFFAAFPEIERDTNINKDDILQIIKSHIREIESVQENDVLVIDTTFKAPASLEKLVLCIQGDTIPYKHLYLEECSKQNERIDITFCYVYIDKAGITNIKNFKADLLNRIREDMYQTFCSPL